MKVEINGTRMETFGEDEWSHDTNRFGLDTIKVRVSPARAFMFAAEIIYKSLGGKEDE